MSYEYREVKCPQCGHVFMWEIGPRRPHPAIYIWIEYKSKATGEYAYEAVCPECGMIMAVAEKSFVGYDVDDERFDKITMYGI